MRLAIVVPLFVLILMPPARVTATLRRLAGLPVGGDWLCHCVLANDQAGVARLLARGVSPDSRDSFDIPALDHASANGQAPIVRMLLARGADPNITTRQGQPVLLAAIWTQRHEVARLLLAAGADPSGSGGMPLYGASYLHDVEMVQLLLDAGADVAAVNDHGHTALLGVLRGETAERTSGVDDAEFRRERDEVERVLVLLLRAGVDPRARDRMGMTPLELARDTGNQNWVHLMTGARREPQPH